MTDKTWGLRPNQRKALMLAKRQLPEFVYDAVQLEGINFSLPEVQTLLDGITVGGHQLSDQQIAVNQGQAWRELFHWLETDKFDVSAQHACALHAIAGKEEALEWGCFRRGAVLISGTQYMPPSFTELDRLYQKMLDDMHWLTDIYDQAIHLFLTMARCQFFYDVNKRMGRFMMNGWLLHHGYPAINLLAKYQLTFNQKMLTFYQTGNQVAMNEFMKSCLDERVVTIMQESG